MSRRKLYSSAFISLLFLLLTSACSSSGVKHAVNVDKLIEGKSKVPGDKHEAIPSTYYELSSVVADSAAPPSASNATSAVTEASVVVCVDAHAAGPSGKKGQCAVQLPNGTFTLGIGDSIQGRGVGEVQLTCVGDQPANCKIYVIN